ncbi:hypothetical protein [Deinococcus sp.]|uniref:hypothetical protein n=1 Tax=Deinococcus sp. TaxID=47478 RepID=UPI0028698170|nr:hypothetical protein [Deinococcus sp.]
MRRPLTTLTLALLAHAGAQDLRACGGQPGLPAGARDGVYRGSLGGRPIALQVSLEDFDGLRYFYERIGVDIQLTAFHQGHALILQEEVHKQLSGDAVVTGCFTLTPAGSGLKGTWHAPASPGARLSVSLDALDVSKLPLNLPSTPGLLKLRHDDPLAFLKLNRAWVKAPDGRSVREPYSQLTYPRLPGGSAALNGALQDRQLRNAADALDCRSQLSQDAQRDTTDGYQLTTSVTLLRPTLISLREDVYYYCGGAHPDDFTVGLILDRATGKGVPLTQLWPTLNAAKQEALYLAHPAQGLDPDCREVLTAGGLEFTAHLRPVGLSLTPTSLPHVVSACGDTAVIPYAELRALVNRASPYLRDLTPR